MFKLTTTKIDYFFSKKEHRNIVDCKILHAARPKKKTVYQT